MGDAGRPSDRMEHPTKLVVALGVLVRTVKKFAGERRAEKGSSVELFYALRREKLLGVGMPRSDCYKFYTISCLWERKCTWSCGGRRSGAVLQPKTADLA